MNVVIVDYGMGNIKSVVSALKYTGVQDISISSEYEELKKADKLILPGVGAFGQAMKRIKEKQIDLFLKDIVLKEKKPILGICLGMQLLGISSSEDGYSDGLGFIDGEVRKFNIKNVRVPHVGFNQVKINKSSNLYFNFPEEADFYFTHSYRMTSDKQINQSMCKYENEFVASFEFENIVGTQFHPELSQHNGLNLFKNFIERF
ncbi:imidazole glycerol phosphate synthase subunit HisH [Flavobacteriaceae bacterium]|nr:imidazole glycerol phosphate synthase subunit HisH [Flavobacteriaceae bacterium]